MGKVKTSKFLTIVITFILSSCGHCEWTKDERAQFEKECPKKNSFNYLAGEFRGFNKNEFDSVLVIEANGNIVIDSFLVKVDSSYTPWEKEHKVRGFKLERKMFINHSYKFVADSSNIFTLKNMEMVIWARGPFCPECTMGNYNIDSTTFEHNANPCFIKKGFIQKFD